MSIFTSWWPKTIRLTDGPFWARWFGGVNWAGRSVTVQNSVNLSAWWRGVKLYAEVAGALPFKFYEKLDNDERRPAPDHQVAGIIGQDPNADQTTAEFWSGIGA